MKWVTRSRPKTDRIACPWLIRRFIDPAAEILYVPADQVLTVAEREGANSFDAPGATYDHRDGGCTFETLIAEYGLGDDPALLRLARIVHAADIVTDLVTDPAGPGLLALGLGGLDVEADDHVLLERASFVYDALYAWCARQTASRRPMTFSHGHIAVTAAITGVLSAGVGMWRLTGRTRVVGSLAVGAVAGLSVYLFRASVNLPQLNADGLPGMSANDWLAPVMTFVALGVLAGLLTIGSRDRYGQVRATATIIAFAVNVITI